MIPEDNRFESDPDEVLARHAAPARRAGRSAAPDPADRFDVARLTHLLRAHERHGRGWAGSSVDDVLVEVSEPGLRMRENVVLRDPDGEIRAWGSVHDRAEGRMLFVHIVERGLPDDVADQCSDVLFEWADGQAREVGAARGLDVQQIDTGAFADDERQHRWLARAGFDQGPHLVADEPTGVAGRGRRWSPRPTMGAGGRGVPAGPAQGRRHARRVRPARGAPGPRGRVRRPLQLSEETFEEFLHRLREDPGHRWDHWWLAELTDVRTARQPVGALVGTVSESPRGPDGSYVSYLGVLEAARGRGVAKGLLHTIIADAAARGRDRVGLEVDADSPTGAARALHVHGLGDDVRHRVLAPGRAGRLRRCPIPWLTSEMSTWPGKFPGQVRNYLVNQGNGVTKNSVRGLPQRRPQRPVHPVGGEYADELGALLDAHDRPVVAQQHRQRLLERGVDVDGGGEVAGADAVEGLEVGGVDRGDRQPAQARGGAHEVGDEVVGGAAQQLGRAWRTAPAGRRSRTPRPGRPSAPPRRCRG